jgi:hypothetical protein
MKVKEIYVFCYVQPEIGPPVYDESTAGFISGVKAAGA